MTTAGSNKSKSKTIAGSVFEHLKDLGSETVKSAVSEAGKIASGVPQNILRTTGQVFSENIPNQNPQSPEKYGPKRESLIPKRTQDTLLFSNQTREEEIKIGREIEIILREIKQEIVILEKKQKMVIAEASRISMQQLPEKVGVYHIHFFEWILSLLQDVHKKVSESATWLSHLNNKRKRKGYWAMFKKHGTKFGLSGERTVATQSG